MGSDLGYAGREPEQKEEQAVTRTPHATLRYTTARLGLFVGCLVLVAVLAYVGVLPEGIGKSNPLWIVLLALVLSALLSYPLLRGQRDAMAEQVAGGVERAKGRLAANRSMEDDAVDAAVSVADSAATEAPAASEEPAEAEASAGEETTGEEFADTPESSSKQKA